MDRGAWEDPLEKEMATTSVFLPEESHGQRNLMLYSPWGDQESDMTDQVTLSHVRESYDICLSLSDFFHLA